jgi:transposase
MTMSAIGFWWSKVAKAASMHRTRQLLVRQHTMLSNALRGHLAELGIVAQLQLTLASERSGKPLPPNLLNVS